MSHYFFTDIAKLSTQIAYNEFGPAGVTTSPIHDKYRVTSLHTASEDVKAYAVCKGILFVQEQSNNANLVNIVLKPLEQPPFNLPKVKFYIYKGVKKSSLIDGNNIATDTDLYDSIILDYAALNTGATTAPKEILGITASVLTTDSISSVFSVANFDHQLPVVNAGSSIGVFDKDGFGFEIHLEAFGFEPTIAQARTHENIILVPKLPSTPTQAEFFEHWHDKEAILNYLDPCAFWGSFFDVGIKVFSSAIPPPNPNPALKKESTLVTEVLAKFTNKNKVYIDIRNEFNFSINYFKNYGTIATNNTTDVKLTKGSSGQTTVDYYGNNWPILILDGTGFGTTSTNHQVLGISLPCGNGDNPEPVVYLEKAYKSGSKFPSEFFQREQFIEIENTTGFTNVFNIGLPYFSNQLVAGYTKFIHAKRFDSTITFSSDIHPRSLNVFDGIINVRDVISPMLSNSSFKNETNYFFDSGEYDFEVKVVNKILINTFNNSRVVILEKTNHLYSTDILTRPYRTIFSEDTLEQQSIVGYLNENTNLITQEQFSVNSQLVKLHNKFFGNRKANTSEITQTSFSQFFYLTFDSNELVLIEDIVNAEFNLKYPIYLLFNEQGRYLDDLESTQLIHYKILLGGIDLNSTNTLLYKVANTDLDFYINNLLTEGVHNFR